MSHFRATSTKPFDVSKAISRAIKLHGRNRLREAEQIYNDVLAIEPNNFDALHMLGVIRFSEGKLPEAADLISKALAINGGSWRALYNHGRVLAALSRLEEAVNEFQLSLALEPGRADVFIQCSKALQKLHRYEEAAAHLIRAIGINPNHTGALLNLGNTLFMLCRDEEALRSYDKVLKIDPNHVAAHDMRAATLSRLKRFDEALASHKKALEIDPNYVEAHNNLGNTLETLERFEEALEAFDQALAIRPDFTLALYNRGNALARLDKPAEALLSFDRALAIDPNYLPAANSRIKALRTLDRLEESLAASDRVLAIDPDHVLALNNRGLTLRALERGQESLACFDRALAVSPEFRHAHHNRGNALNDMERYEEAIASFDKALAISPTANSYNCRGNALLNLARYEEAIASFEKALAIEPDHQSATNSLAQCVVAICDWESVDRLSRELNTQVAEANRYVSAFNFTHYSDSPESQLKCARRFYEWFVPSPLPPLWKGEIYGHDKIRIVYASADFHNHNTGYLMAELFEKHDRNRFDVIGLSFGKDDGSRMRARLIEAFDQFHDVIEQSDRDAAELLRSLEADIVIDLKGYTQHCRPGILAHRPAPITVNYLGFQGTMGTDTIDYILGDEVALPFQLQPFFSENIVHLPVCHQVNQPWECKPGAPSRSEVGLPQDGVVFCCFNDSAKLTSDIFSIWMRLLSAVNGSVLWIMDSYPLAVENMRRAADARGVDPARLVFAPYAQLPDHLRRHRLADLFLDTLPVNAHTSASRALWAGLPILTCTGNAFAGRISASLLHAAGLPELVTQSLEEYEALAKELASDPPRLQGYKRHLLERQKTSPLFDTDLFRGRIEKAYTLMWERYQRGEAPSSFTVHPDQSA